MMSLKFSYPHASCEVKGETLWWFCNKVKPTPISREYSVEIIYRKGKRPRVYVLGDELMNLDATDFPHKYSINREEKRVEICLYRYASEFSSEKLLSKTVIPWTVEWLFFYELWLATGEWLGGGEHPCEKME